MACAALGAQFSWFYSLTLAQILLSDVSTKLTIGVLDGQYCRLHVLSACTAMHVDVGVGVGGLGYREEMKAVWKR